MVEESDPSKKKPSEKKQNIKDENNGGDNFDMSGDYRGANIFIKSNIYGDAGDKVRLQNLRDFTVQIRKANHVEIVGTGIAVSTDGKIITCARVIEAALGKHPRKAIGEEVSVYFPQLRNVVDVSEKKQSASIIRCLPKYDDDIVLLQLKGNTCPLAPEQIAVLGVADQSEGNSFDTYGYSSTNNFIPGRGAGVIQGSIEPLEDQNLQIDPIQLKSRDIALSMSGAAVLDKKRNLVVGLIVERFYFMDDSQDDLGYGVDSKVLMFDPFDLEIRNEALELKPAPEPKLDKEYKEEVIRIAKLAREERSHVD